MLRGLPRNIIVVDLQMPRGLGPRLFTQGFTYREYQKYEIVVVFCS